MESIVIYNSRNIIPAETFAQVYELILSSFPKIERRSKKGHYDEFNVTYFNSMCYQPDRVKALMNYWFFDEFVFLEHFAVSEELRGQGIGSLMMKELQKNSGDKPIVLEAEPPDTDNIALRRIEFYKRLGFSVNEFEYWQPALQADESPIKLVLLTSKGQLLFEEFERMKYVIYKNVYNVDADYTP